MLRPRSPRRPLLAVLALGLALSGCAGEDGAPTGLTPETFADVIVELREAERRAVATDSAVTVYDSLKAEILERHGTTEKEIIRFVEASHRDLPMLAELWEEMSTRLRHPAPDGAASTAPAPR